MRRLLISVLVFLGFMAFFFLVGYTPWSPANFSFKSRHYGNSSSVAAQPPTTVTLTGIDTAFAAYGPKHISITNTSTATEMFVNLESARAGQLNTSTYNPGARIGPGMTKDFDFCTSQFEMRVATGAGFITAAWEVTQ